MAQPTAVIERFWEAESGWVLWRVEGGLLPFNRETRMAMIIEDDEEARVTYDAMIHDGVPIVDNVPSP